MLGCMRVSCLLLLTGMRWVNVYDMEMTCPDVHGRHMRLHEGLMGAHDNMHAVIACRGPVISHFPLRCCFSRISLVLSASLL